MGFRVTSLWSRPEINPLNRKARSIPVLNPINVYGRVFFFSWWGFMVAFWSWYAFPPLMTETIKKDLHLSQNEISNSNIIALVATLLVRVVAGPSCDRFGPKNTFAACLLIGSIPTFLAGTVTTAKGLMVLRFFVGILGGSFVPCQVWSTGFFDKNVVGTANALTGGWGNAGGGITYFVMPAIFNSLVKDQGMTKHVAWRVSFVVPGILIVVTACAMLMLCPDTPTGKWSERHLIINGQDSLPPPTYAGGKNTGGTNTPKYSHEDEKPPLDEEAQTPQTAHHDKTAVEAVRHEVIRKPSLAEASKVVFSFSTVMLMAPYFCTFGAELAINSILGAYYLHNFKTFTQSTSGNWAAMFGLLNVISRPLGGILSDILYKAVMKNQRNEDGSNGRGVYFKKIFVTTLAIITGVFQIAIGLTNPHTKEKMMALIAFMALFLESTNGAVFALVPHVHPSSNGIVSGLTGASGNFGGIIFAIIFRYLKMDYQKGIWIIGIVTVVLNVAVGLWKPVPKNQIGGR